MKGWRYQLIQNPLLYHGLSTVGWILSPHVYINLMELIVFSSTEPDMQLVNPAWYVVGLMLTLAYFSSAFCLRYILKRSKAERNIALILALMGCLLIPWQLDILRNNVMPDGTFNDKGLRIIVGGALPTGICVGIALYEIIETCINLSRSRLDRSPPKPMQPQ